MSQHFADRLTQAIRGKRTPAVVAIDPVFHRLPDELRRAAGTQPDLEAEVRAIREFSRRVIQAVAPLVPAVKLNSAYFERYGAKGIGAYFDLIGSAARSGLLVIGDVKRGDVGHSAAMYAAAQLADPQPQHGPWRPSPDAVTVNGYLGLDAAKPFIDVAKREDKGLFVLVRTSNPSGGTIQDILAADGRKLHQVIAAEVANWAADPQTIGQCGYSCVGAVVASRDAGDAAALRRMMPRCIFLVPGYGAQGGTAEDVRAYFDPDGAGALVAAGRSVIFAYEQAQGREKIGSDWEACVRAACEAFIADLRKVVPVAPAEP